MRLPHRLLRDQYGIISRDQLMSAGWTSDRVRHALDSDLVRVVPGVYRSRAHVMLPESLVYVGKLWLGEQATLIRASAAWWWGLQPDPPAVIRFAGPRRTAQPPHGLCVHQVYVDEVDRVVHRGIVVQGRAMSALRAAADLEKARPGQGIALVDRAIQQGLDPRDFIGVIERHRFCSGNALGRFITDITSDRSESVGERRTAALMRQAKLNGWQQNVWVLAGGNRYRLDFCFPAELVAVEFDGFAFHSTAERFSSDRRRLDDLQAAGWRVVQVTWLDLHAHPQEVIRRVKRALSAKRPDFGT